MHNIINQLNEYAQHHWGTDIGIHQGVIKSDYSKRLKWWINQQYHASMNYLSDESRQVFRNNPHLLFPELLSIIVVRIPYQIESTSQLERSLTQSSYYVAEYAQGRDYHKVVKKELELMAQWLQQLLYKEGYNKHWVYRTFTDSAPIMEVALAQESNLGWRGKNTLLIHEKQGSFYFLGELFTSLPLFGVKNNSDQKNSKNHCGSCTACLTKCPTNAILEYTEYDVNSGENKTYFTVNANKCISYWTIEHQGDIPLDIRKSIGNRLYGCDDCQIYCPWNQDKFTDIHINKKKPVLLHFQKKPFWNGSDINNVKDIAVKNKLSQSEQFNQSIKQLIYFLSWNEVTFLKQMEGTAIRRIGYISWIRNLFIVMGNLLHRNDEKYEQNNYQEIEIAIKNKMQGTDMPQINWLLELGLWALQK